MKYEENLENNIDFYKLQFYHSIFRSVPADFFMSSIVDRGDFGMGFFWDPNSNIPNPRDSGWGARGFGIFPNNVED